MVQNLAVLYLVGKRGVKYFYPGVGKNLLAGEKGLGYENEEIYLRNLKIIHSANFEAGGETPPLREVLRKPQKRVY